MGIALLQQSDFSPKRHDEAARVIGNRVAITDTERDRLTRDARAQAFYMSSVHKVQLIQAIRDTMQRGLRDGKTFATIREELLALFKGEGIPPLSLHRLRFAFQENARRTYSDARRAELQDPQTLGVFPFWKYLTKGNGQPGYKNVRPEHAALHDKVFRADDPFWNYFYPPWDFGCRCDVISMTEGQVRRAGATIYTYQGGRVVPADSKRKTKGIALAENTRYDRTGQAFDLSSLDADLRKLLEDRGK